MKAKRKACNWEGRVLKPLEWQVPRYIHRRMSLLLLCCCYFKFFAGFHVQMHFLNRSRSIQEFHHRSLWHLGLSWVHMLACGHNLKAIPITGLVTFYKSECDFYGRTYSFHHSCFYICIDMSHLQQCAVLFYCFGNFLGLGDGLILSFGIWNSF